MGRSLVLAGLSVVLFAGSTLAGTLVAPDQLTVRLDNWATSPHGLSADFGGTYKIHISGAPDSIHLNAFTLKPIYEGDTVTLTLAHSYLGNFSGTRFWINGVDDYADPGALRIYNNETLRDSEPINTLYTATWIADGDYAAGTDFGWGSAVWPGTATYWFKEATVTRAVPLPAAGWLGMALIGALCAVRRCRRRRAA